MNDLIAYLNLPPKPAVSAKPKPDPQTPGQPRADGFARLGDRWVQSDSDIDYERMERARKTGP